jgi:uncharacterized protein
MESSPSSSSDKAPHQFPFFWYDKSAGRQMFRESMKRLVRFADLGITDIRVGLKNGSIRIRCRHEHGHDEAWLPLEQESHGTQQLFVIAQPVFECLAFGSLLVVDELESSLHPLLAQRIVQLFNDPQTNPHNAQLIFATHDTNLLGTTLGDPVLRRDQIWFTEKDEQGGTVLYPLTDFKPRKAENLERGYLQGRYGAIPFLGNFELWGEPVEA